MCDYTQVEYACGHLRFIVRAWCVRYQETHIRCPANVVAIEYRLHENCGDCRATTAARVAARKQSTADMKQDNKSGGGASGSSGQSDAGSSKSSK